MKKISTFALCAALVSAAGCNQIYYHNATPAVANKAAAQYNEWHHDGVFGLVEFSEPVNLKARCERGWNTVETENSFLTGLVSAFTYALYTPREANVVCK
jgi:Bor protein